MKCPKCGSDQSSVIDKRDANLGTSYRRRRRCDACRERFTTYERIGPKLAPAAEPRPVYEVLRELADRLAAEATAPRAEPSTDVNESNLVTTEAAA